MQDKKLRVVFMGTPDFAVPALKNIFDDKSFEVVAVYSQPPRPSGRGHKVTKSPIHLFAEDKNIPIFSPSNFKDKEIMSEFLSLGCDVAVVAAYGLILPEKILNSPKYGCLNIHASLLPRWRGASPIQHAIWAGDKISGVTIMQMEKGLDTGPMLLKKQIDITAKTTASILHDQLSKLGGEMIIDALKNIASLKAEPQNNELSSYAKLLTKQDGEINWQEDAIKIDRQIRALNPWPATFTNIEGKILKIISGKIVEQSHNEKICGKILNKQGDISCGNNTVLRIEKLKPANSKAMDFASALNGGYVKIFDRLL